LANPHQIFCGTTRFDCVFAFDWITATALPPIPTIDRLCLGFGLRDAALFAGFGKILCGLFNSLEYSFFLGRSARSSAVGKGRYSGVAGLSVGTGVFVWSKTSLMIVDFLFVVVC
jgi:hypothetical protein